MFNDPRDGGFPEISDGQYVIKCERLEDADPGQYGPRVKWVLLMWDAQTKEPVTWDDGSPYEWWRLTSTKTGPKSTARKWMQAFLNREITNEDTGAGLASEVQGKFALAMISTNDDGYPDIVSIKPHVKQAAAASSAKANGRRAAAPPAEPEPEPVGAAAGGGDPFADIDPDDAPF